MPPSVHQKRGVIEGGWGQVGVSHFYEKLSFLWGATTAIQLFLLNFQEAESRAKKQLGSGFKNIQGDDFGRDAASLNRFMQQLLHHPVFGHDKHLVEFLEHENPPPRAKLKKSGWSALVNKTLESSGLKRGSGNQQNNFSPEIL